MKTIILISALMFLGNLLCSQTPVNVYQVSNDPEWAEHPGWTNDGNNILIESNRSGVRSIWKLDAHGLEINPVQLTNDDDQDMLPRRIPNSNKILFSSSRHQGNVDIFTVDKDTKVVSRVTTDPGMDYSASCSHDGNTIAFISTRGEHTDIWIRPLDGGNATPLTSSSDLEAWPVWSPDNNYIAFYQIESPPNIYIIPSDGSGLPVKHIENAMAPAWSPDGSMIAYSTVGSSNNDIWIYKLADSSFTRITTHDSSDFNCSWSPDGSKIAFTSRRDGNDDIYVVELSFDEVKEQPFEEQSFSVYPNPFLNKATIELITKKQTEASIHIYSMKGELIRTLLQNQKLAPSKHQFLWDGLSDNGEMVKPGVYICRLKMEGSVEVKNLVLL